MFRIFSQYVSAKCLLLMMVEGSLIVLSLICAAKLRFWNSPAEFRFYVALPDFAVQSAIVVGVCLACFYYNELYDLSASSGSMDQVLRIEQSLGAASLLLGLLYFMFPNLLFSRGVFIIGLILVTILVVLSRRFLEGAWQLGSPIQRVVILGTGALALELAREVTLRQDLGMKLEGFVSGAVLQADNERIFGFPILGSATEMEAITKRSAISRIIVALENCRGVLPAKELVTLRVQGVRVDDAASVLSALTGRIPLHAVKPSWFVFSDGFHRSKWNELLKRTLDLAAGIAGLVLALPIMALVAFAILVDSKGPVIYRQTRVGRMDRCFDVLKFRSMRVNAEQNNGAQWAVKNDPRVTRVGGFLRKYRLDELPQFLNVVRGDMSFVGPRPERPCFVEELRKQIPYYDERHSVRPGITGWAQVQYSYGASVEDAFKKLEYDLFYLKNTSVSFDMAIILKTVKIVISGHNGR